MQLAFDLISDLHVETWGDFDWHHRATSPIAVVAGDVCKDLDQLQSVLTHLGQCYQAVFYIDGNDEHKRSYQDLGTSYANLAKTVQSIPNVVFLQNNVVVIDGVAFLGTNGWWSFDFDFGINSQDSQTWLENKYNLPNLVSRHIRQMAINDASYMVNSVKRLQAHQDVKHIVMITHTVPDPNLISHDIDLDGTHRFNCMGNRYMMQAIEQDAKQKIHTWCFGHYHGSVDQIRSGVRFVNNCRGRGDTNYHQYVYHPRRIIIDC